MMALESPVNYISDLVSTNPVAADPKSEGDDHIRNIKTAIKASFPNVSGAVTPTHTELNYVDGVTSAIQTQIDTKAPVASPTFTGTPAGPTATTGTSTTQLATTEFVANTSFTTNLPAQTGNSGKRLKTNGTNASWDWSGIRIANIAGETLTDAGSYHAIIANAAYTLPTLTNTSVFGLVFPNNASAVPTSVTLSDNWTLTTGAVAGTLRVITPVNTESARGLWLGLTMNPPTLATLSAAASVVFIGSAQIDTNLVVVLYRTANGTTGTVYAAVLNTSTNQWGAQATVGTWSNSANAAYSAIFADSTSSFVVGFQAAGSGSGRYEVHACSINTGTLAITVGANATGLSAITVDPNQPLIKLANGLYAFTVISATDLYAISVSGTTSTAGTGVASGSVANGAKIRRVSNTEFLAVYAATGGGTAATRSLSVRVCSVSGTTITTNTAAAGGNICADDLRLLKAYTEGSSYIVCCKDGTTATTGNYYGVTVSGTAATLGSLSAQANNLPVNFNDSTYIFPPAEPIIKYNSTTMLFGHLAAGPFAITISGSTLTVGSSGGPATTVNFLKDTSTQSIFYAVGASNYDKLSVSGTTITSSWQVAATPSIIASDSVNDKTVTYSSTVYAWTLPAMAGAITADKWLRLSGSNYIYCGAVTA